MRKSQRTPADARVKPNEPPAGRMIGYARVSTQEQNLDLQLDALRRAGVPDDNLYSEKVSGAALKRPMLDAALMDCRQGDTLLVWKLDRFGRSLRDLINRLDGMEKRGVAFRSLTDGIDTATPVGKFTLHLLGALAQFERDLTVVRTRAGMKAYRDRGGQVGAPRALTDEQIKEARRMLKEGRSVPVIAKHFGVVPMTIYKWAKRPVKR